jgi:hypothetical protein
MTDKINCLWFLPFSEYDSDVNVEIGLINGFHLFGHNSTIIRCGGYLKTYCTPMNANRLKEGSKNLAKSIICKSCRLKGDLANRLIHGSFISQKDHISENDKLYVEKIIKDIDLKNWKNFKFNDIPIGRFAAYEVLLNNKIGPSEIYKNEHLEKYIVSLRNSLICAISFGKIIKTSNFDVMFVRNSLYSINRVASWIANQQKIKVYSIQTDGVLSDGQKRIYINKWDHHPYQLGSAENFLKMLINTNEKRLSRDEVNEYVINKEKDISLLAYSEPSRKLNPNKIRAKLGIKNKNKNVLVTLSSGDEISAATVIGAIPTRDEKALFTDQNSWLEFLINVANHFSKINFIFRIHPRETRNRRDIVESSNYSKLLKIFNQVPDNVYINYPKDRISIHDIFSITDLNINFGSTTGLEALALGIPSISQDAMFNLGYPSRLGYEALKREDYYDLINLHINSKINREVQNKTTKWLNFLKDQGTFVINSNISIKRFNYMSSYVKNSIFKIGKGVALLNLIKKIFTILKISTKLHSKIEEQEIINMENQLLQLFEMVHANETHYIKRVQREVEL